MKYFILVTLIIPNLLFAQGDYSFFKCDDSHRVSDLSKNISPLVLEAKTICESMDELQNDAIMFKKAIFNSDYNSLADFISKGGEVCKDMSAPPVDHSAISEKLLLNCPQARFVSVSKCANEETIANYCSDMVLNVAGVNKSKLIQEFYNTEEKEYPELATDLGGSFSACADATYFKSEAGKNHFNDTISLSMLKSKATYSNLADSESFLKEVEDLEKNLVLIPKSRLTGFDNLGTNIHPYYNNNEINYGANPQASELADYYLKLVPVFKPTFLNYQLNFLKFKKNMGDSRLRKIKEFSIDSTYRNALENLNGIVNLSEDTKVKIKSQWIDQLYVYDKNGVAIDFKHRQLFAKHNLLGYSFDANREVTYNSENVPKPKDLVKHLEANIPLFKSATAEIKASYQAAEQTAKTKIEKIKTMLYTHRIDKLTKNCELEKQLINPLKILAKITADAAQFREKAYHDNLVKVIKSDNLFTNVIKVCELAEKSLSFGQQCANIQGEISKTSCGLPNSFQKNEFGYLSSLKNPYIAMRSLDYQMILLTKALNGLANDQDGPGLKLPSFFKYYSKSAIPTSENIEFIIGSKVYNCSQFSEVRQKGMSYDLLNEIVSNLDYDDKEMIAKMLSNAPLNRSGDIARILVYFSLSSLNSDYYTTNGTSRSSRATTEQKLNQMILPEQRLTAINAERSPSNQIQDSKQHIPYIIEDINKAYTEKFCNRNGAKRHSIHHCLCSRNLKIDVFHYGHDFRMVCTNKRKEGKKLLKAHHEIVTSDTKEDLNEFVGTSFFQEGINLNSKLLDNVIVNPEKVNEYVKTKSITKEEIEKAIGAMFYEEN